MNPPVLKSEMPIIDTIQWMLCRLDQANKKSPIGCRKEANIAGMRRSSCGPGPCAVILGSFDRVSNFLGQREQSSEKEERDDKYIPNASRHKPNRATYRPSTQ